MAQVKSKIRIATDLAWGIVHEKETATPKVGEIVDMLSVMYPGMNYWHTQVGTVVHDIAKPDILKQSPRLAEFNTEASAIQALGETVEISTVRPCKGYEWMKWGSKL